VCSRTWFTEWDYLTIVGYDKQKTALVDDPSDWSTLIDCLRTESPSTCGHGVFWPETIYSCSLGSSTRAVFLLWQMLLKELGRPRLLTRRAGWWYSRSSIVLWIIPSAVVRPIKRKEKQIRTVKINQCPKFRVLAGTSAKPHNTFLWNMFEETLFGWRIRATFLQIFSHPCLSFWEICEQTTSSAAHIFFSSVYTLNILGA
jgi:hypothetical protein